MFRTILIFLFGIISLILINNNSEIIEDNTIDPLIFPYVESFIHEACIRNIFISLHHVTISLYPNLHNGEYAGLTFTDRNIIYINPISDNWILNPESLVFHELGHLLLNRNNSYETYDTFPISIMHVSITPLYNSKQPLIRKYYVDELFDRNTIMTDEIKQTLRNNNLYVKIKSRNF